QYPLTPVTEGRGQCVEGARAAVTPVAFAAGAVVVLPPGIDVLALAPGTLEGAIFPSQRMNIGLTLVDVAVLPTSPRDSRFSLAYSHPYARHPMTWRQLCRSRPHCTQ